MGNKPGQGAAYYADLQSPVIEREINYNGQTRPVYFKRITGGDRLKLNRGQTMTATGGGGGERSQASMSMDMGDITERKLMLVAFSNCDEEGNKIFRNAEQVRDLEDQLIELLHKHAEEVNREDTNEGKASPTTGASAPSSG